VDLTENTITIDGRSIQIPAAQVEVADILASAYPRTATKDFLFDRMYGGNGDSPLSDTVFSVYVCHLRKALKGTRLKIRTTWSVGYRFELEESL
jgi:DNA-binding response OmpR family regulator